MLSNPEDQEDIKKKCSAKLDDVLKMKIQNSTQLLYYFIKNFSG